MRTRSVITKALCGVSLAVALVAAGGAAAQAAPKDSVSSTTGASWTKAGASWTSTPDAASTTGASWT